MRPVIFFRAKRYVLRLHEDFVPNSVVAASFHPVVVPTVEGVISEFVHLSVAMVSAAVAFFKQLEPETVRHRCPKRPRVEVEIERR